MPGRTGDSCSLDSVLGVCSLGLSEMQGRATKAAGSMRLEPGAAASTGVFSRQMVFEATSAGKTNRAVIEGKQQVEG